MRKLLLYVILIVILFSVMNEVRGIWNSTNHSLENTVTEVKDNLLEWYGQATVNGLEIKQQLNDQIKTATEKYQSVKSDLTTITEQVNEKQLQMETTLKEIEEAKAALNKLLDANPELSNE